MKCFFCKHFDMESNVCDIDKMEVLDPWSEFECDLLQEPQTVFKNITASPNILAPWFIVLTSDNNGKAVYISKIIPGKVFDTDHEAINATVDKLNTICNEETDLFIKQEIAKAKAKHPQFPVSKKGGIAIIAEEFAELALAFAKLCQGVNDKENNENLREEAAHVAVTAARFIEALKD